MGATQLPLLALTWLKHNSSNLLVILVYLILLDFVSGFIKAFVTKTASSDFSTKGAIKKAGVVIVIGLSGAISPIFPQLPMLGITCLYFIGSEGLSVLENVAAAGVPIPSFMRDALIKIRDSGTVLPPQIPPVLHQTFNNGPINVDVPQVLMEKPQHHDPPGTGSASFRSSTGTSATAAAYLDVTNRPGIWDRMFPWHRKKD